MLLALLVNAKEILKLIIDIWGSFDGDLKASGTLTIQEAGVATGTIEYQKMQIKLGGKLSGDIKISDKIQPIKTEKKIVIIILHYKAQLEKSKTKYLYYVINLYYLSFATNLYLKRYKFVKFSLSNVCNIAHFLENKTILLIIVLSYSHNVFIPFTWFLNIITILLI